MKTIRKFNCLIGVVLMLLIQSNVNSQNIPPFVDCYAVWNADTLSIENNLTNLKFLKTNKGLDIHSIENKELQQTISFDKNSSVFSLGNLTDSVIYSNFKIEVVPENPVSYGYLMAEFFSSYEKVDIKTQFRIYSNSPMIAIDFFVKKKTDSIEFTPNESNLINLQLIGKHWLFKSVEFFDWTDYNNTLVQEHEASAFIFPLQLKGNILQAKNVLEQNALIIIKEAACSIAQLSYPGYDFYSHNKLLSVSGIGVSANELLLNSWVKTYSLVLGVTGSEEFEFLTTVRAYQKKLRKTLPERDDMIMMNTWGDRSLDTIISEKFIKDEIDACNKLHFTHFQIDDGWESGRSAGSADPSGALLWDAWDKADWQPDSGRFPNGLKVVADYAKEKGVQLGLWFHPSNINEYARWKQDAQIVIDLYNDFGIKYFKIDGVKLLTKLAEINFRSFLDSVSSVTNNNVVFNLDMTHDKRGGYFYLYEYGNIFLENRYTDWVNYYPHWTLRNLWHLSKYVPSERLQVEFLNNQRNKDKYPEGDFFAPSYIPFDYTFAVTMMAQPLAWFEGTRLNEKAYSIAPLVKDYLEVQSEIHSGQIFPIGDEPSGRSWTGFQSILDGQSGYVLVFREKNEKLQKNINLYLPANKSFNFKKVLGYAESFKSATDKDGNVTFSLPEVNQFVLYKYVSD